jgi:hypothetical protein
MGGSNRKHDDRWIVDVSSNVANLARATGFEPATSFSQNRLKAFYLVEAFSHTQICCELVL